MAKKKDDLWIYGGLILAILILLWLAFRPRGGYTNINNPAPKIVIDQYALNPANWIFNPPGGYTININVPAPTWQASSGCDCGCQTPEYYAGYAELYNSFSQSLQTTQTNYTNAIMDLVPDYLLQFWNNPAGFIMAENSRLI